MPDIAENDEIFPEGMAFEKYMYNSFPYGSNGDSIYNNEYKEQIYDNEYAENIYKETENSISNVYNGYQQLLREYSDTISKNYYNSENVCGYVDNMLISNSIRDILPQAHKNTMSEGNMNMLGSILSNYKNLYDCNENISGNTDFYYDFADNVNNFGDKSSLTEEKSDFIHNISNFTKNDYAANNSYFNSIVKDVNSLDYSHIKRAADSYNTNNYSSSDININMGGITQNITEGNCEDVMDMLVEGLLRGLSCKAAGVY